MLYLESQNQFFSSDEDGSRQGWVNDIREAVLYYDDGLDGLIKLIDEVKDLHILIKNLKGELVYDNRAKLSRIEKFIEECGGDYYAKKD